MSAMDFAAASIPSVASSRTPPVTASRPARSSPSAATRRRPTTSGMRSPTRIAFPAGSCRSPATFSWWALPARGQCRRHDHDLRAARAPRRHLGVRRCCELGRRVPHPVGCGDDATPRTRRPRRGLRRQVGRVRTRCGRRWLGLALLGLDEHLATGAAVNPDFTDPALLEFMRRSSDDWCRASIAYGTPRPQAEDSGRAHAAAYTGG